MTAAVPPLHVRVMGETVAIVAPDQETYDRLAHQWSRAVVPVSDGPPVASVTVSPSTPDNRASRDYRVASDTTRAGLEATTGRRVNLHAGGVADAEGRLLAVVAPSGTGKTTATLALAKRLGYVSDETVSIDPGGTVAPHPKPLSVIVDPLRRGHKEQLSPDDLGLLPTPDEPRLARLVVLHRGGDGPRGLSRLPTTEALLQLIEQSSSLSELPQPLRTMQALIEQCQGVWALTYDEITDHVDELVALLSDVPADDAQPQLTWHDGEDDVPLEEDITGPLVARLPWVEAVGVGDELVVLTKERAWYLAGLTATVWRQLAEPRSIEDLVGAAEARYGAHDRAEQVVLSAVATLGRERLVSYGSLA